jgi:imidazole glycerol phosphate synthase glutamine amidotransferase subunit
MTTARIVILPTGTANTASVMAGLERAGASPRLAERPQDLESADGVVVPGVGSFKVARLQLEEGGFWEPLRRRVAERRPTLAICLGLQLLAEGSMEDPGGRGLGLIPTQVNRFPAHVRVPHMGWNKVTADPGCRLITDGEAYFANSYCLGGESPLPATQGQEWHLALTDHGGKFIAACESGSVLACQFHPELSGEYGSLLLRRWTALATGTQGEDSC